MTQSLDAAEEWVHREICYGGLEYPLGGKTAENCVASFKAGAAWAEKRAREEIEKLRAERDFYRDWAEKHKFTQIGGALAAVKVDAVKCQDSANPVQYCITQWCIDKTDAALSSASPRAKALLEVVSAAREYAEAFKAHAHNQIADAREALINALAKLDQEG